MNGQLDGLIHQMINYIHTLAPDVRVEHVPVIYEDEHANLKVYPPLTWSEEECLDLHDQISERVVDVLVDFGYLILVYVYSPEQQIQMARHNLVFAQQQQAQATHFLQQAAVLGLA